MKTGLRGFSLIELLIAMAIASIVGLAGVSIFSSSNWSQKTQEDITEAQQNVRVATDRLTKDIRTAGFGLPDPPFSFTFTVPTTFVGESGGSITLTSPITVTTSGGTGAPDSLTILGIGYETGTLSKGSATDCNDSGKAKICLDSVASTNNFFSDDLSTFKTNRKYISLDGTTYIELSSTQSERASAKLTLGTPAALDRNYPDGTPIYIIQTVQYTIVADTSVTGCSATNPCLTSNDATELRGAGRQLFSENIEDIQFAYGIDVSPRDGKMDDIADGAAGYAATDFLNAPTDNTSIIAVRATIVGRTRNTDIKGQTGFKRPAAEDRTEGASDGYRRKTLIKVIKIRNPKTGA